MFDYEHDRMSNLCQSARIHHQAETQQTVRQGEEFLWSVYLWLICLPSWLTEAEHCSALPVPQRCRQTDKPLLPQRLQRSPGPSEALQTVVWTPWQTNPSPMPSSLLPSGIFVLALGLEKVADGVGGGLFRELQRDIAGLSRPVISRLCEVWEQAVRQGSAGTFGICSYQQERSALQSLQGEGGEPVWKQGSTDGLWKNWKTGQLLAW